MRERSGHVTVVESVRDGVALVRCECQWTREVEVKRAEMAVWLHRMIMKLEE